MLSQITPHRSVGIQQMIAVPAVMAERDLLAQLLALLLLHQGRDVL
jgi:hypothetical protein